MHEFLHDDQNWYEKTTTSTEKRNVGGVGAEEDDDDNVIQSSNHGHHPERKHSLLCGLERERANNSPEAEPLQPIPPSSSSNAEVPQHVMMSCKKEPVLLTLLHSLFLCVSLF